MKTSKDIALAFTAQATAAGFKVIEQTHEEELTPTVLTTSDEEFKKLLAAISLPIITPYGKKPAAAVSYFSVSTERTVYPIFKNAPASQYE